jgi:transcriptional regulator GlxA family with amidase domain
MTSARLAVLTLTGAMRSSVAITLDLLDTANRLAAAAGKPAPFECIEIAPDETLPDNLAAVVVPGLGASSGAELDERLSRPDAIAAIAMLRGAADAGTLLAASCSSVFLLAAAGLLQGRRATTTWWLAPLLGARHPDVIVATEQLVVADGNVITAGAAMAQMDLMLALIARYAGAKLASLCARYLLLDERRSQSRYMALGFLAARDPLVARAEAWAQKHLGEPFSVNDLAGAVGLAPRTFARRVAGAVGMSPVRFVQRLRVEAAVHLIETTRVSIEEIAHRVGYAESSTLRRMILREMKLRPGELRSA